MSNISDKPNLLEPVILIAFIGALYTAPLVYFLNRYFGFSGIWSIADLSIVVVHFICGILAILMGCLVALNRYTPARDSIFLIAIPISMVLLSVFQLVFHEHKLGSWYGASQLGQGIVWYLDLAILIVTASYLVTRYSYKNIICLFSCALIVIFIMIHESKSESNFIPYRDYLADYAITIPVLFTLLIKNKSWFIDILTIIITLSLIYYSQNLSAMIIGVFSWVLVYLFLRYSKHSHVIIKKSFAILVVIIPLVITLIILKLPFVQTSSIWSRTQFLEVGLADSSILTFFTGHGWGSYSDLVTKSVNANGLYIYGTPKADHPMWDAVAGIGFHSHNNLTEAFISTGILGVLICSIFPCVLIYLAQKQHHNVIIPFCVSYVGIAATWFQWIFTLPLLAFIASSCVDLSNALKLSKSKRRLLISILSLAGFSIIFSATHLFHSSLNASQILRNQYILNDENRCNVLQKDGRAGEKLGLVSYSYYLEYIKYPEAKQSNELMKNLYCSVNKRTQHQPGLSLILKNIQLCGDILQNSTLDSQDVLKTQCDNQISHTFNLLLDRAPNRTDLLAPYFYYLIDKERDDELAKYSKLILTLDAKNAIALWFLGLVELNQADLIPAAMQKLELALKYGIDKKIPIEKDWINMINAYSP